MGEFINISQAVSVEPATRRVESWRFSSISVALCRFPSLLPSPSHHSSNAARSTYIRHSRQTVRQDFFLARHARIHRRPNPFALNTVPTTILGSPRISEQQQDTASRQPPVIPTDFWLLTTDFSRPPCRSVTSPSSPT